MEYLNALPDISSIGVDGDIIDLELEQEVEELFGDNVTIVLTAKYAGQIVVTVGKVIEHENIEALDHNWCRIKIKGSSVTFTI